MRLFLGDILDKQGYYSISDYIDNYNRLVLNQVGIEYQLDDEIINQAKLIATKCITPYKAELDRIAIIAKKIFEELESEKNKLSKLIQNSGCSKNIRQCWYQIIYPYILRIYNYLISQEFSNRVSLSFCKNPSSFSRYNNECCDLLVRLCAYIDSRSGYFMYFVGVLDDMDFDFDSNPDLYNQLVQLINALNVLDRSKVGESPCMENSLDIPDVYQNSNQMRI